MYYALDVSLEVTAREAVEYALMEGGALGTETTEENSDLMRTTGYFDSLPERERIRAALFDALRIYSLPSSAVRDMQLREVAAHDWLAEWKKNWQPVEAGCFIIAPPWTELDDVPDKKVIRIEPGMAFGTGTHETTRLCLAVIEKHFKGGSFLDVGTGTGILAIAAAKLFPTARIEACDTDAEAIAIARENAQLNGVAECIRFRVGTIDDATASADCVCANLTADVIMPLLPTLINATCSRLILSGILNTQINMVRSRLSEVGIGTYEVLTDGEWMAIII